MTNNYIQKVLSVDDIATNNFLIQNCLEIGGIETMLAESGKEALEIIDKNHFSLFILDVMMNNMDGFELALKIREIKKYKSTPIIFVTGISYDSASIVKGYESGAVDYITKPFKKEILLRKVSFFLELDRQKQEVIEQRNKVIESQKRFYDIAISSGDWIWEVDNSGKYVYVSDRIEEVLGFKPFEVIGKTPFDLMTPRDAVMIKSEFGKFINKRAPIKDLINWNISKSGDPVCLLTNGVPIFNQEKQLIGYRGVDKDITSKIKSDEELNFQAKLLQNVNDSIIYTNLEGIIQYVNHGTNYTFGYKPKHLIGKTLSKLFPEQYKDLTITDLFVVIDFQPYQSIWQGTNKNGDLIWLDVKINLMHTPDGKMEGFIIVSKDITLIKKAEVEIIRSLITGEDKERQRVASDLHDSLGQILTASSLNFNSLKQDIKSLSAKNQKEYQLGLTFLNDAIVETRNIAYNLMPKSITQFGLINSITTLINSVKKSTDFNISLTENIGDKRLDKHLEINMYRITQEILNNAIKHSKAKKLSFQYQVYNNELIFTYEDNGVGFNFNMERNDGEGLSNIKNRVTSMSGFLSINSTENKGTSISIELII